MTTSGTLNQLHCINEEQHSLASALGRVGRGSLPHLEWDEISKHMAVAWVTSTVSAGLPWGTVESIVREAWEKASCAGMDTVQTYGVNCAGP